MYLPHKDSYIYINTLTHNYVYEHKNAISFHPFYQLILVDMNGDFHLLQQFK